LLTFVFCAEKKRIGILTGGGDCPGLNAVIRAACLTCISHGYELVGLHDGFEGNTFFCPRAYYK
jgi:6-phosphofructokinase